MVALAYEDHCAGTEDRYLSLCKDFSRRTGKGNCSSDEEIAKLYGKLKAFGGAGQHGRPVTLASIKMWANEDNPQLYKEVVQID